MWGQAALGTALPGRGCRKGGPQWLLRPDFAPWCLQGDPGPPLTFPGTMALWDPRGTLEKEGKKGRVETNSEWSAGQLVLGRGLVG